jgi:tetratricopeptide (TPR) repeat protein
MKAVIITCLITALFFAGDYSMSTPAQSNEQNLNAADSLFKAGKFDEAEVVYKKVIAEDPDNYKAILRLGYSALLSNHLDNAETYLKKAIGLKPDEKAAKSLLAETFYRRDDFQQAAPLLRDIGRDVKAEELESFKGTQPYQIQGKAEVSSIKFVMTDPLPVVKVKVNDSEEVNFFIDTGGAELIIDAEFAQEVKATLFGSQEGTFAGGKKAAFQQGCIDSLTLGDFMIRNVPVAIMNVRQFSQPVFGGTRVDGIIGTVLLYHFLSTLDYPKGELILRRRTKENLEHFEQKAKAENHMVVPFWMAGDHFMVAWGSVNKSEPLLFFVDTGLAGRAFTCPESTVKAAGIKLQEEKAGEGIGGGGKVKIIPFVVDELTLGDAKEHNIPGLFSPGASGIENAFGFHIGGLISHGFFKHYAITFDFDKMRLFLKEKEK